MTTTLYDIVREMLGLERSLGRVTTIASLTATTAVVSSLATGTVTPGKYGGKWMWRPLTTTAADRIRLSTEAGFSSSTGTLTHAGANYADTTTTGELLFILEHEPELFFIAVQRALGATRRLDTSMFPTRNVVDRYWMHELDWITGPGDIWRIYRTNNPVLSRNRHLDKWNAYNATSGVLVPDKFVLSGAAATMARSTTGARTGQYTAAITRAGTDWLLSQTVGLLETEVSADSLRGKKVTGVLVGDSSAASDIEVEVTDGVDTTTSTQHAGDGITAELSVEHTVNAAATGLAVRARGNVDGTPHINQLYLVYGTLDDTVRRDQSRIEWEAQPVWEQGGSTQQIHLPAAAVGGQYVVESWRPYPQLDATLLLAGSADAHVIDAPAGLIARVALGFLFEALPKKPATIQKAIEWTQAGAEARAEHMAAQRTQRTGLQVPAPVYGPVPSRPY